MGPRSSIADVFRGLNRGFVHGGEGAVWPPSLGTIASSPDLRRVLNVIDVVDR